MLGYKGTSRSLAGLGTLCEASLPSKDSQLLFVLSSRDSYVIDDVDSALVRRYATQPIVHRTNSAQSPSSDEDSDTSRAIPLWMSTTDTVGNRRWSTLLEIRDTLRFSHNFNLFLFIFSIRKYHFAGTTYSNRTIDYTDLDARFLELSLFSRY